MKKLTLILALLVICENSEPHIVTAEKIDFVKNNLRECSGLECNIDKESITTAGSIFSNIIKNISCGKSMLPISTKNEKIVEFASYLFLLSGYEKDSDGKTKSDVSEIAKSKYGQDERIKLTLLNHLFNLKNAESFIPLMVEKGIGPFSNKHSWCSLCDFDKNCLISNILTLIKKSLAFHYEGAFTADVKKNIDQLSLTNIERRSRPALLSCRNISSPISLTSQSNLTEILNVFDHHPDRRHKSVTQLAPLPSEIIIPNENKVVFISSYQELLERSVNLSDSIGLSAKKLSRNSWYTASEYLGKSLNQDVLYSMNGEEREALLSFYQKDIDRFFENHIDLSSISSDEKTQLQNRLKLLSLRFHLRNGIYQSPLKSKAKGLIGDYFSYGFTNMINELFASNDLLKTKKLDIQSLEQTVKLYFEKNQQMIDKIKEDESKIVIRNNPVITSVDELSQMGLIEVISNNIPKESYKDLVDNKFTKIIKEIEKKNSPLTENEKKIYYLIQKAESGVVIFPTQFPNAINADSKVGLFVKARNIENNKTTHNFFYTEVRKPELENYLHYLQENSAVMEYLWDGQNLIAVPVYQEKGTDYMPLLFGKASNIRSETLEKIFKFRSQDVSPMEVVDTRASAIP